MLAAPRGRFLFLFGMARAWRAHRVRLGLPLSRTSSGLILRSFTKRGVCVVLRHPTRWNYWLVTYEARYEIARLFSLSGPPIFNFRWQSLSMI